MVRLLQFLLTYRLKDSQPRQKTGGFTLIELLVGLILAFLVIIPLLGFVVDMMTTDRQEQAKATSEQEIQAALNYISRDLDQAIYIYDGVGLKQIWDRGDGFPPIPAGKDGVPVLAFWKRKFLPGVLTVTGGNDDAFAYSLVVYYLLKEQGTNCRNSIWSCTAQIGRVELQNAVTKPNSTDIAVAASPPGFPLFNLSPTGALAAGTLDDKMNAWPNGATYDRTQAKIDILIDYIDQSPTNPANPNFPKANCPATPRASSPQVPYDRQSPPSTLLTQAFGSEVTGFYACVETEKNLAKVYIRGNALARMRSKNSPMPTYPSTLGQISYFPSGSIQVQSRGAIAEQGN